MLEVPARIAIKVLGTTDVHGHIRPHTYFKGERDESLGLAKIATLIKRERAANPNVLYVDSGDLLQGSPLVDWFRRYGEPDEIDPMIAALWMMDCVAFGIGNHDYNYGLDVLYKARKDAPFPFLSANVFDAVSGELVFDPYVLIEVQGVKVGIIGTTPPGVAIWDKAYVQDQLRFGDIVETFKKYVPELKAMGADVVIGIPHTGLGGDGEHGPTFGGYGAGTGLPRENVGFVLAREIQGLDALFLGHTHQAVALIENGVAIVQAEMGGKRLAAVEFILERQGGHWQIVGKTPSTISTAGVPPDPDLTALSAKAHAATLVYVNAPIAATSVDWASHLERIENTPLMDLINQVQRESTGAQLSAVSAFNTDIGLTAGQISIAEIAAIYPVENTLVAVEVTGKQLRDFLEYAARYFAPFAVGETIFARDIKGYNFDMVSGVDYEIDLLRPEGSRITRLDFEGSPVTDDLRFSMAMNSYRQRGGGGYEMLEDAPVIYSREENIRELLIEYLRKKKSIEPDDVFQNNWRIIPQGLIDTSTFRYMAPVEVQLSQGSNK